MRTDDAGPESDILPQLSDDVFMLIQLNEEIVNLGVRYTWVKSHLFFLAGVSFLFVF